MQAASSGHDLQDQTAYLQADLLADLVMKGGITSGVIYPWAVCEIARKYRLRNIGGSSAGAIAAAAAAAAEVGRRKEKAGFARLATLPVRLSKTHTGQSGSVLLNLFQPSPRTRPYFRIATAALRRKGGFRKLVSAVATAILGAPMVALAGALLGLAAAGFLLALALTQQPPSADLVSVMAIVLGLATSLVVAVAGAAVFVVVRLAKGALKDLPANGFGMCWGYVPSELPHASDSSDDDFEMRDGKRQPKPLTTWLSDELDALAGRSVGPRERPLTLGDLAEAGVNLRMFTTSLTEGTPYTMPFRTRNFFFEPDGFRRYFPPRVVDWMEKVSPVERLRPKEKLAWDIAKAANPNLLPLPDAAYMPVIVMTRFSLSFPILLSAVPLWRVFEGEGGQPDVARECWFSDGGITSNFPVHFFDAPLPRWPTFGINLDRTSRLEDDEGGNIWAPLTNDQGAVPRWGEISGLIKFLTTILDTMQNWMDNAQTKVPGYRDRILLVKHTKEEGGINLSMPQDVILRLADRGAHAGRFLVSRFAGPVSQNPGDELSWENHRWLRFRMAMPLVEEMQRSLVRSWDWPPYPALKTYTELIDRPLGAFPWCTGQEQGSRAHDLATKLVDFGREWGGPQEPPDLERFPEPDLSPLPLPEDEEYDPRRPFACGAPRPRPTLRIVRDF